MESSSPASLNIAMYPWLALGHQTAHFHLANKLAERGQRITFFAPKTTQSKLSHFNLHPNLITFVTVTVPQVEGLPPNAETTSDLSSLPLRALLMTAMDQTQQVMETHLSNLKPDIVFYDYFSHWLPPLARSLGIKAIHYCTARSVMVGYLLTPARINQGNDADLTHPPPGYPGESIKLHIHEAQQFHSIRGKPFGSNVSLDKRMFTTMSESDALAYRTCREIEGPYLDYVEEQFKKPVILSGPVLERPNSTLDEKWASWLQGFKRGSVVYCCFGSECRLESNLFHELVLGLELANVPFLAALKAPIGFDSVEDALPEGFEERVAGRGIVYGGWVQQPLILEHPSVGCFITHCGSSSCTEALLSDCQIVLIPDRSDQFINARMMGNYLQVGLEVEKGEEDGLYTKESVCNVVSILMDNGNETSKRVRAYHAKLREKLLDKDLESTYNDNFCKKLRDVVDGDGKKE
ncbi:UDP-glycosyltransferase 79B30 [Stylosanthes scabra]|uniref:Glycosyltransferase n=1 Tax=Stylosanthes scabra TaxID=79078 RepID=A0ABU6ZEH4_9FABA|nr:UDP-glycosyltransferase 79B30 [Stylosanthes scabra]